MEQVVTPRTDESLEWITEAVRHEPDLELIKDTSRSLLVPMNNLPETMARITKESRLTRQIEEQRYSFYSSKLNRLGEHKVAIISITGTAAAVVAALVAYQKLKQHEK